MKKLWIIFVLSSTFCLLNADWAAAQPNAVKECQTKLAKLYFPGRSDKNLYENLSWVCRKANFEKSIDPAQCFERWRPELSKNVYSKWTNYRKNTVMAGLCFASRGFSLNQPDYQAEKQCENHFLEWAKGDSDFQGMTELMSVELCRGATSSAPIKCFDNIRKAHPKLDLLYVLTICRAPKAESNFACFQEAVKVLPAKDRVGNLQYDNASSLCEEGEGDVPVQCYKYATEKMHLIPSVAVQYVCTGATSLKETQAKAQAEYRRQNQPRKAAPQTPPAPTRTNDDDGDPMRIGSCPSSVYHYGCEEDGRGGFRGKTRR